MAGSIGWALARIKQELDPWIDQRTMDQVCRASGYRWRVRVLDPLTTVHWMLLQLLAQVGLSGLRHVAQLPVSVQALCRARQRLPLGVLLKLVEHSCVLGRKGSEDSRVLWHGLRVFLGDGMSVLAPDTPSVRGRYGGGSNQHGVSCSYPLPKLLALLDWGSGLVRKVIALPHARNEKTCLSRLLGCLCPGDLLLCDRGLSSFAHVALMMERGVACCIGVPRWLSVIGQGKGCHRRLRKLGANDLLVKWIKPPHRPRWMSGVAWSALPGELVLRQVNVRVRRPGFRGQWLRVITTLTDERAYPASALAALYARRWQVEVYFRDLKSTLKMSRLSCRTAEGVRKEVAAFVLLYNLVRQVMMRAARSQEVAAERISFIDATRWLLWTPAGTARVRLRVNLKRSRPSEPRVLKHGRRKYPLMNRPRADLRLRLQRQGRTARQS